MPPTAPPTFLDALRAAVERSNDRVAFTFLGAAGDECPLRYAELDARARSIAAVLREHTRSGDRALLLYPAGLEFISAFCGCLYAGIVAVPTYPPRNDESTGRLERIAGNARPSVVLTTQAAPNRPMLERLAGDRARVLSTDTIPTTMAAGWRPPSLAADSLAFLQYSSGSTGEPRGVMVTHGNLLENEDRIRDAFGHSADTVVVGWLPHFHDMGLVGNVLQTIYLGAHAVLMPPLSLLMRPARWLQAISRYHGTTAGGPNMVYDLCAARIADDEKAGLDLSTWTVAFNGSEPVHPQTMEAFAQAFAPCGFRREAFLPCYGLAESTLLVSAAPCGRAPRVRSFPVRGLQASCRPEAASARETVALVSCGRPPSGSVAVVDAGRRCPEGREGEIWARGGSVSPGYWEDPQASAATFGACLDGPAEGPFLRTGDLGVMADGELYITGRIKDVIILHGRNYYPHDIERVAARAHPSLRLLTGAAFAVSVGTQELVVLIQEVRPRDVTDLAGLIAAIRACVTEELEIPLQAVWLVRSGEVPRTTSGKVRRQRCRDAFLAGSLATLARWSADDPDETADPLPRGPVEEALARLISEVLRRPMVGRAQSLFSLGADSVTVIGLLDRINQTFGVELTVPDVLTDATLAGLACRLAEHRRGSEVPAAPAGAAVAELSDVQAGIWADLQRAPHGTAYHLPMVWMLPGTTDADLLRQAWHRLVYEHEILRTTFAWEVDRPVQRVRDGIRSDWEEQAIPDDSPATVEEACRSLTRRAFDIHAGPLWRVRLLHAPGGQSWLLFVIHHLAADGFALQRLWHDWLAVYEQRRAGADPVRVPVRPAYRAYVSAQRQYRETAAYEESRRYWLETLHGELPPQSLPGDFLHQGSDDRRSASRDVEIPPELARRLATLAAGRETSPFVLLLAAFAILLRRLTGANDLLIGTPLLGRSFPGSLDVIGPCVNATVLRVRVDDDAGFVSHLDTVRRCIVEAVRHEQYPFRRLVQELGVPMPAHGFPLVRVFLNGLTFFESDGGPQFRSELAGELNGDVNVYIIRRGGGFILRWDYCRALFRDDTVGLILGQFLSLLRQVDARPNIPVGELALFPPPKPSAPQAGAMSPVPDASLPALFAAQTRRWPDRVAVESGGVEVRYAELDRATDAVARRLRSQPGPAPFVAVVADDPLGAITAMLGVLKAGLAYVPIDPAFPEDRAAFLITDAGATTLLTTRGCRALGDRLLRRVGGPARVLSLEEAELDTTEAALEPVPADRLAYLLYTSGTTGRPKGVLQTHRHVVHFVTAYAERLDITAADRLSLFSAFSFDAAVLDIFTALLHGATLVGFRSPASASLDALPVWLSARRITVWHSTPSFYRQCLRASSEPVATGQLRWVVLGGEAVTQEDVRRHHQAAPGVPLVSLYGQSESTLNTLWVSDGRDLSRRVVLGSPVTRTDLRVQRPDGQECALYQPGEIVVESAGVAAEYWNRPEETRRSFGPGRCYRTGDQGRRFPDGQIEFLGRLDDQVKVRGYRIELGEVTGHLQRCPGVQEATVTALAGKDGDRELCAYWTGRPDAAFVRDYLRQSLPAPFLPGYWVRLDQFPLTPNGKIDRHRLPDPRSSPPTVTTPETPPVGPVETLVASIWQELLSGGPIGRETSFFDRGGDSLKGMQVLFRIQQQLGCALGLADLLESPTVAALAERVAGTRAAVEPIRGSGRGQTAPLSFAQERMWFLQQLRPDTSAYHIAGLLRIRGPLETDRLGQALAGVVGRHEVLRTTFHEDRGKPFQRVRDPGPVGVDTVDLSGLPCAEALSAGRWLAGQDAIRRFDLQTGPLLRARLYRLAGDDHLLGLTLHHLIADGWSLNILAREFATLYRAAGDHRVSLPPALAVQYADFAVWQRQLADRPLRRRQLDYWQTELEGLPDLELPTDRPRPASRALAGGRHPGTWPTDLARRLATLARTGSATLPMVLLAALQVVLARYARQSRFPVGLVIADRQAQTDDLIGLFINTLVVRADLDGEPTFRELLDRVRQTTLRAYAHRDVPFSEVVARLRPARDAQASPLFAVVFDFQSAPQQPLDLPGLSATLEEVDPGAFPLDLALKVKETATGLHWAWEYVSDLFDRSTIQRLAGHFERILKAVAADPDQPVSRLPWLAPEERAQVLHLWNETQRPFPDVCAHQLVEQQAALRPESPAVITPTQRLTYGELNARADRLARTLRAHGVGPDVRVALCAERGADAVVGILGVLKAGGAYVPLDPEHPPSRLARLIGDCRARLLLTQRHLLPRLAGLSSALCLDAPETWTVDAPVSIGDVTPQHLAYVIYTSGTTGAPKGVGITHCGVVNLVSAAAHVFDLQDHDRVLASAPIVFDASVEQILCCLARGATLHLGHQAVPESVADLVRTCHQWGITVLTVPTAYWHAMVPELANGRAALPGSVRLVIIGGEPVQADRLQQWRRSVSATVRLVNGYGPTEVTVAGSYGELTGPDGGDRPAHVPIGRPLANTRYYIVDSHFNPVPAGVPGELCIAGVGLARGYLDRPGLTSERFLPDPFSAEPGRRLYRTGDLCRWTPDGCVEFLGRLDAQLKVRGYRIEPGEIETALARHAGVQECAVVGQRDAAGECRLVAYVVPVRPPGPPAGELRRFLAEQLPAYMVTELVTLPALPLSSHGKVDRRALATRAVPSPLPPATSAGLSDPGELALAAIWEEVLHREPASSDDDFFECGGHSLKAVELVARIQERCDAMLSVRDIFTHPTLAQQARLVDALRGRAVERIPRLPDQEHSALSAAQRRIWIQDQLEGGTQAYNLCGALVLDGGLSPATVQAALDLLVERHESLRTSFIQVNGDCRQRVNIGWRLPLEVMDLRADADPHTHFEAVARGEAARPFDLRSGPPVRARLLRLADERQALLLTLHHILADGWSGTLLQREFFSLCRALTVADRPGLVPPPVRYRDYAAWHNHRVESGALDRQKDYWLSRLTAEPPIPLELPLDHPRPAHQCFAGGAIHRELAPELVRRLETLGRGEEATLFMVLLAAVQVLLFRHTDQEHITVGTQVSGRDHFELTHVVGFFVNTVLIQGRVDGRQPFREVLRGVREITLEALEHQEYPFDLLVDALPLYRPPNRNPLFDVQVDYVDDTGPPATSAGDGWRARVHEFAPEFTKYDLSFVFVRENRCLRFRLVYSTAIFEPATMERFADHLLVLLRAVVEEPDRVSCEIEFHTVRPRVAPLHIPLDLER